MEFFTAMDTSTQSEARKLTIKKVALALSLLILLFVVSGFLSLFFEPEVKELSDFLAQNFGFWALAGFLFFSDTFISPFPPDIALFFVAKSALHENWLFYVSILATISTLGGHAAWWMGQTLVKKPWAPKFIRSLPEKNQGLVKKFGPLFVALGALTPLPFSITCWSAGFIDMRYRRFALASLLRFPRIFIAYWAIVYSDVFHKWFGV
jgi:membrane protein YqaA with SNARE-associated domain